MVIRGWGVSFIATNGDTLTLPAGHVIVQDPSGSFIPRCTIYIVAPGGALPLKSVSANNRDEAAKWHETRKLEGRSVVLPVDDWVRLRRVAELRYWSLGEDGRAVARHRRHPYGSNPQWVSEHRVRSVWKIKLPDGCLIDHRGFRYPLPPPERTPMPKGKKMSAATKHALAVGRAIAASRRGGLKAVAPAGRGAAFAGIGSRKTAAKKLAKKSPAVKKAAKKAAGKAERKGKRKGRTEAQTVASLNNVSKAQAAQGNAKAARATKAEALAAAASVGAPRKGRKGGSRKSSKTKKGAAAGPTGAWRTKSKVTRTTKERKNKKGQIEKNVQEHSLVLNPKSMKGMDIWAYAGGILTLAGGFVGLGVLHAYVVNRPMGDMKHGYIGKDATLRQMAKPTPVVYLSGAGLGVAALAGAAYARQKGWTFVSGLLGGLAAAGFLYPTVLALKHEVAPRLFQVKTGNEVSFANMAFPSEQLNVQAALQAQIDAQNGDPVFIGKLESAPGFGDVSYVYGQANGTPLPGVDGTGANLGIITIANTTSGFVALLDPTRGSRPKLGMGNQAAGRKWIKDNLVGTSAGQSTAGHAHEPSNHAAGCGGNCGKPCCGKPDSQEELLAEAVEFDQMAAAAGNSTDGVHFRAAAAKLRRDAAALVPAQNQAAGAKPGDEQIQFGDVKYVRADLAGRQAPRSQVAQRVAGVPASSGLQAPLRTAPVAVPELTAPSAWEGHSNPNHSARPEAYVPTPEPISRAS